MLERFGQSRSIDGFGVPVVGVDFESGLVALVDSGRRCLGLGRGDESRCGDALVHVRRGCSRLDCVASRHIAECAEAWRTGETADCGRDRMMRLEMKREAAADESSRRQRE